MDCNDCNTNRMEKLIKIVKSSGVTMGGRKKQGNKENELARFIFIFQHMTHGTSRLEYWKPNKM